MLAPAYLLKSRHGIYYFRIRVAGFVRQLSPNASGEIRVSLNTRDKNVALYLSRRLWIAMKEKSLAQNACKLEDWEVAADVELQKYFQGKDLIARFDKADPTDTFALHELAEHISRDELKNYVFAWEHDARRGLDKHRETAQLVAEALIRSGVFTKGPFAPLASHGFFEKHSFRMQTDAGRDKIVTDLEGLHSELFNGWQLATKMVSLMLAHLLATREGGIPRLKTELAELLQLPVSRSHEQQMAREAQIRIIKQALEILGEKG